MTKFQQLYDEAATPELKEEVVKRGVREVIHYDKKEQWADILKSEYGISKSEGKEISIQGESATNYSRYYKILAVAASLMFLVLAGQQFYASQEGPTDMAMSYLAADAIQHPGVAKGIADEGQDFRQAAIKAFDARDYKAAIDQFYLIPSRTTEDQFYLGVSLLQAQDYDQSIGVFNSLEGIETIYTQELNWYKSLALLLKGDVELAKESLSFIGSGDWNSKKAAALLESLQEE